MCGRTCNATDEARIREVDHNSSLTLDEVGGMVGYSYLAVCEWEAVKHLPLLCNGVRSSFCSPRSRAARRSSGPRSRSDYSPEHNRTYLEDRVPLNFGVAVELAPARDV